MASAVCLVGDDVCAGEVPSDAPIALCRRHLAVAAEWADAGSGATDVIPSPCRVCGSRVGVKYPSGWVCAVCEWRVGAVVDDELPPPRVDVVYYLRVEDRVKIGTSMNPRARLGALWHDELLAFERGGRVLEHRRHTQFASDRYGRTEWFQLSAALAAHLGVVSAGVDDPWSLYTRWVSEALALQG